MVGGAAFADASLAISVNLGPQRSQNCAEVLSMSIDPY
jgi:hypothetical protein